MINASLGGKYHKSSIYICLTALLLTPPAHSQVPVLSELQVSEGAPGTSVVIAGEGFGQDLSQVTVSFGRSSPIHPDRCAEAQVVVRVPPDAVSGDVIVTVLKEKQENAGAFKVLPVSLISPTTGTVGSLVTISGNNLGSTIPPRAHVTFQGSEAHIRRWSPNAVIVTVPSGARSGAVVMTIARTPHNVGTYILSTEQRAIELKGGGVGALSESPQPKVTAQPEAQGTNANPVATKTEQKTPGNGIDSASLGERPVSSQSATATTKDSPGQQPPEGSLCSKPSINPAQGAANSLVSIKGSGFGDTQGNLTGPNPDKADESVDWPIVAWTDTAIVATVPDGAVIGKNTITVKRKSDASKQTLEFTKQNMTPTSGPPGTMVKITGSGFGDSQGSSTVKFGSQQASMAKPWTDGEIEVIVPNNASAGDLKVELDLSPQNGAPSARQEGEFTVTKPIDSWSDDDETPLGIYFVGGFEEGIQSSQSPAYNPFLAVYGRKMFGNGYKKLHSFGPFFNIRLISAPSTTSTDNITSVFADPSGAVTSTKLSAVGSAVDLTLGTELGLWKSHSHQTSVDLIFGGGAVTPIQANTENSAFTMPAFGTVECTELQQRIVTILKKSIYSNITPNAGADNSGDSCFGNNAVKTSAGNPTAINTLVWATPDQSNFFGRAFGGFRLMNRYRTASDQHSCGPSSDNPCERGHVDVTVGQDASITGGMMRHWVVNVEAMHPLPVPSVSFVYLFGSISKRFFDSVPQLPPLILTSATPPTEGPSPAILVLPLQQPDRDFYRIGIGVRLDKVFTALGSNKNSSNASQTGSTAITANANESAIQAPAAKSTKKP